MTAQPLHSTGITLRHRYYWPLRLPSPRRDQVMVSPMFLMPLDLRGEPAGRLSQISRLFFRYALSPITPTGLICAFVYYFHISSRLRPFREVGRRQCSVTRPKRVHFIRARIFVVGWKPLPPRIGTRPTPQCFACFVTYTRQRATT